MELQDSERIFIGLWPTPQDAARMMAWVQAAHGVCGGRPMAQDTLHLTLAFLGPQPRAVVQRLRQQVAHWRAPVGELVLRRLGCFVGPRVVWAGPEAEDIPPWLSALHSRLWQRLDPLGFTPDHLEFRPHVSLLRRAGNGDLARVVLPPLVWRPAACRLVASRPATHASRYQQLAALPITDADTDVLER